MDRAMSLRALRIDFEVRETTALIERNKEETARRLTEKQAREQPDKEPRDFAGMQEYVIDGYTYKAQFVFADDKVYMEARGERDRAFGQVTRASNAVGDEFRYQRNGIITNYGDDLANEVGVGAPPDHDRTVRLRQADNATTQMARPEMAERQPLASRGVLEWLEQSKRMKDVADVLRTSITVHTEKKADTHTKMLALDKSTGEYRATYGDMIGIQKRLYRQAGLPKLADKLAQIRRQARRLSLQSREDEEPQEQQTTEAPAASEVAKQALQEVRST